MKTRLSDWKLRTRLLAITFIGCITSVALLTTGLARQQHQWQTLSEIEHDTQMLVLAGAVNSAVVTIDAVADLEAGDGSMGSMGNTGAIARGQLERALLDLEQLAAGPRAQEHRGELAALIAQGRAGQRIAVAGGDMTGAVNGVTYTYRTLSAAVRSEQGASAETVAISTLGQLSGQVTNTVIAAETLRNQDAGTVDATELQVSWALEQQTISEMAANVGDIGDQLRLALSNGSQANYADTIRAITAGDTSQAIESTQLITRLNLVDDTRIALGRQIVEAAGASAREQKRTMTATALGAALGAAITLAAALAIGASIRRSIRALNTAAHDLARGKIGTCTITPSRSELGALEANMGAVEQMLSSIAEHAGALASGETKDTAELDVPGPIGEALAGAFQLIDRRTRQLADSSELHQAIIESAGAIWCLDLSGTVTTSNHAATTLLGYDSAGRDWRHIIHGYHPALSLDKGAVSGVEVELIAGDGSKRNAVVSLNPVTLSDTKLYVLAAHDISERKQFEQTLAQMAVRDSLTGLPNRAGISAAIAERLDAGEWTPFSALFIDLDRFKAVNDTFGHAKGDMLLRMVCERAQRCVKDGDIIGRLAGDEFIVLLNNTTASEAETVAWRLVQRISEPYNLDGNEARIGASIGVTEMKDRPPSAETVLEQADLAMYAAKNQGRGRVELFDETMATRIMEKRKMELALARAVENGDLTAHYQPVMNLAEGTMIGVELLCRWEHEGQAISPDQFIPIAEETGLIVDIGVWALDQATKTAAGWRRRWGQGEEMHVAVNISTVHLLRGGLVEDVRGALLRNNAHATDLVIELTETSLLSDVDKAIGQLRELRDMGVRVSIDDFGTGYSSLGYLRNLPVDTVKIDRSFVSGTGGEKNVEDLTIVKTVIGLAAGLDLDVVAEGIETAEQMRALEGVGCSNGQGYLFSKPLTIEALEAHIETMGWKQANAPEHPEPAVGQRGEAKAGASR